MLYPTELAEHHCRIPARIPKRKILDFRTSPYLCKMRQPSNHSSVISTWAKQPFGRHVNRGPCLSLLSLQRLYVAVTCATASVAGYGAYFQRVLVTVSP